MCLILLSYDMHPFYRMVFAANRDEYYSRPTAPVAFLDNAPDILGGLDLNHNGMWLGITRTGRFAAITNFRNPGWQIANPPSRGFLVSNFIDADESAESYLEQVKSIGQKYNGFNILVGDKSNLLFYSNIGNEIQRIKPGLYGLGNKLLDTPWPKIEKGKACLEKVLEQKDKLNPEDIFHILKDNSYPPDNALPDTGVGLDWERILSPIFITSQFYGTRSSSIIFVERSGSITFLERTFVSENGVSKEEKTRKFNFETSV
jgi:uncharacterized protein with NRDE domain